MDTNQNDRNKLLKIYFAKSEARRKIPAYDPIPEHLKFAKEETDAYLNWVKSRPCDHCSQKWCLCVRERLLDN